MNTAQGWFFMTRPTTGLTFWDHIKELRSRLIVCIVALVVGTFLGGFVARRVLTFLTRPLASAMFYREEKPLRILVDKNGRLTLAKKLTPQERQHLSKFRLEFEFESDGEKFCFGPDYRSNFYYFGPIDPFILWLKAAFIVGVILSLPIMLWEGWAFVKPGMTVRERRAVIPIFGAGMVLFPIGVAFAYFMLQFALGFFSRYAFPGLEPRLGIMQYMSFALTMMLAAGCVFELPVAIVILARMGLVSSTFLKKYRAHAVVILFILAAALTPPDIFTMFAIALPLLLLYEISILVAGFIEKKRIEL